MARPGGFSVSTSASRRLYGFAARLFNQFSSGNLTRQYIPPMPPHRGRRTFVFSGISDTSASVVSMSEAMDAAFCSAVRTTLVGSMTPAAPGLRTCRSAR